MNSYIIEFLGALLLSFVVFSTGNYLAIGAILAIIIMIWEKYSSIAFNPSIALALTYAEKLPQHDLITYIIAEIAGTLVGFELFKFGMGGKI